MVIIAGLLLPINRFFDGDYVREPENCFETPKNFLDQAHCSYSGNCFPRSRFLDRAERASNRIKNRNLKFLEDKITNILNKGHEQKFIGVIYIGGIYYNS